MTTRTISVEAIALRNDARARHAEQDALILQDDIIQYQLKIKEMSEELEFLRNKFSELEGNNNGTTS